MKRTNLNLTVLILFFAFILSVNNTYSQWISAGSLNGVFGRPAVSVVDEKTAWVTGGDPVNVTYLTTNAGDYWKLIPTTGLNPFLCICAKDAKTLFAGDNGAGGVSKFYKTTDGGESWIVIDSNNSSGFRSIKFSASDPSFGIALGGVEIQNFYYVYSIFKTTNGGNTWTKHNVPEFTGYSTAISSLNVIDSKFYAFGTTVGSPSVILTTNGGQTYSLQNLNLPASTNNFTRGVAFKEDKMTGIASGCALPIIARTTNGGQNWVNIQVGNFGTNLTGAVMRWVEETNTCYMTTPYGTCGVLKSTNGGLNWTEMTTLGLPVFNMDMKKFGDRVYGYANSLTNNTANDILRLNDILTSDYKKSRQQNLPFINFQNYPNPFNPVTKIKFEIIQNAGQEMKNVKLTVYDALGKEVAVLLNEKLGAGKYEADFDAGNAGKGSNYSSGVYFYKLEVDGLADTKKMYLIK